MEEPKREELLKTEPYSIILSRLRNGAVNATPADFLCRAAGLTDRVLRKYIETLRVSGVCIISDVNGYYFPESEDDLERYIRRTEKTARSYFYSLRSAKRELSRMKQETQIKIEE